MAQRKAELEREKEGDRDEELDAMMEDIGHKPGPSTVPTTTKETEADRLGRGVSDTFGDLAFLADWSSSRR